MNTNRIYNPVKQGYDHDPDGVFTRQWVPELEAVPDEFLQEPWKWEGAGDVVGKLYPERIVDHAEAAREARSRISAIKRTESYRAVSEAVFAKHGSRKRPRKRGRRKVEA